MCPDPLDIFAFLEKNDIGCREAIRYIAHAALYEKAGSFDKARLVFEDGFNMYAYVSDICSHEMCSGVHNLKRSCCNINKNS